MKRLINITELSEMTGVKVDTLYRWVSQRRISHVKVGRLTKFDLEAIDQWIKDSSVAIKDY
ncbi:MAG: helix-turn-helix domain-containing protein [Candidatus Omnitrophica bacterium]|nr:helix-turn-helix domain-containing protein [Candidatus Omnitrophota bacterium]